MTKHPALKAAALVGVLAGAAALLSRRYIPVKVEGPSMLPTLRPGDRLIVDRGAKVLAGSIVVVQRSERLTIVKRVRAFSDDGGIWLAGDNAEASTDSRDIGAVSHASIVGVARAVYGPISRIHRLRVSSVLRRP